MSFDLVFFGGTGDLTWRKLMPALFQAFRHGKLPAGGRILSVARDEQTDDKYRAWLKERFQDVEGAKRPSDEEFARFAELVHYRRMDLSQPEHYGKLKQWLEERGADTAVLYLATSPHLFPQICQQLGAVGLNAPHIRVVLEKPLGHDLASAQEINRVVRSVFSEAQAFRIDHYLGKPSVQNLSALRFGNALFEPLWRRESIANIQITIAETLGVGTRGDFYDRTGALREPGISGIPPGCECRGSTDPGGVAAISRWLSAAIPPVRRTPCRRRPRRGRSTFMGQSLRPLRGRSVVASW